MKKNIFRSIKYLALFFFLSSSTCSSESKASTEKPRERKIASISDNIDNDNAYDNIESVKRKLIKTGRIEFKTENISEARAQILEAVKKYNGYVSSDQEFKYNSRKSNTIVIRIPSNNFDHFLTDATSGVKKFDDKKITVNDVTDEFLDVEARIKTKKELELRYLQLLKQANTVKDILEIEREIAKLRSDIESIEGRLNYLQNSVSYSTLDITFYESINSQTEFGQKFARSFKRGWENFIWFFVILTDIWPFILISIILIILFKYRRRKKNRNK